MRGVGKFSQLPRERLPSAGHPNKAWFRREGWPFDLEKGQA